jgi:ParB-like chromosome segregation protein Spo0J
MTIKPLRIDQLYIADDFKINDSKLLKKLENILKKFGQLTPLLVCKGNDDQYKIIDGVRVYTAAINLKMEILECVVVDVDEVDSHLLKVIYDQFMFDYDIVNLVEIMHIIMEKYNVYELEKILPYSEEELNNFKKLFDFDWSQYSSGSKSVTESKVVVKNRKMF